MSPETGPGIPEPSDAVCIEGYLRGDTKSFALVDGWILAHLRHRYPRLDGQHEDLGQVVHTRLLVNLREGRFEGRSALKSYVAGITHRVAIDRLRVLYRDRAYSEAVRAEEQHSLDNPYLAVAARDESELQRRALFSLPASCRELWKLVFVDELSYDAIGRQLKIPPGTVKSRLWRCRRKAMLTLRRLRRASGGA